MTKVRDELETTQLKMRGALNGGLDSLMPRPARPAAPADVARRQMANILRLSHVCARNTCRRAGSCRGEPSECLRYGLPLLPPEVRAGLFKPRGHRSRRRRRRAA